MLNNPTQISPMIVVCGGIHSPHLTDDFVTYLLTVIGLNLSDQICIIPTTKIFPYDVLNIYNFLCQEYGQPLTSSPLIFISFSAGVVGSIGVARLWAKQGGIVKCLFAFDGWGVPLIANFPCYRISHDYFTHISCQILGATEKAFYAQPSVSHLDLWSNASSVQGYEQNKNGLEKMTIANFLKKYLIQNL